MEKVYSASVEARGQPLARAASGIFARLASKRRCGMASVILSALGIRLLNASSFPDISQVKPEARTTGTTMPKRYSAAAVARYFLAKQDPDGDDLISHLKLQKLCYYAQGVGLATRGEVMFDEPLEAWLHGPVVPSLYREYRDNGNNPLPPVDDLDEEDYDPADRMILDDVYTYYGQFSGWRLRQMTHDEAPWKDAYREDLNRAITVSALRTFFQNDIEPGYSERYDEVSRGKSH